MQVRLPALVKSEESGAENDMQGGGWRPHSAAGAAPAQAHRTSSAHTTPGRHKTSGALSHLDRALVLSVGLRPTENQVRQGRRAN
eukprot:4600545-Pleurochrysis_carterae.AAC.2